MSVEKKELIVSIEKINSIGQGIGRVDGKVIFVDGALSGEQVKAVVNVEKKSYASAYTSEILVASDERISPACQYYGMCGGCQLQHASYELQLKLKRDIVRDAIVRIGSLDNVFIGEVRPSPNVWRYRNKAAFPVRESKKTLYAGFFRRESHDLVEIRSCPLQDDRINSLLDFFVSSAIKAGVKGYDESRHKGNLRHIVIRASSSFADCQAIAVLLNEPSDSMDTLRRNWRSAAPESASLVFNINPQKGNTIMGLSSKAVVGKSLLRERLLDCTFGFGPASFFQVNTAQAEQIVSHVLSLCAEMSPLNIWDLYSGVGAFSIPIAKKLGALVSSVEENPEAVSYGRRNAVDNGCEGVLFFEGKTEAVIPSIAEKRGNPDVVVMDPPRSGCDATVIESVANAAPKRVIYVSCNPATLARDMSLFVQAGYSVSSVIPFDMFPHTAHVECVALMERI